MSEEIYTVADYLDILRRRSFEFAVPFAIVFLISVGLAIGLPAIYTSVATIMIEQQDIPKDLVRSTISNYADQHIQTISQRVMTTRNMDRVIKKYNLYSDKVKTETSEDIHERLRSDISMEMVNADVIDPKSGRSSEATIAFTLSYSSESPELAQKVANELVSLYMNENLRSRTQLAKEATSFLSEEAEKLSTQISEQEKKLAVFKEKNAGKLPELMQLNLQLMQRTETSLESIQQQIRALSGQKIYLQAQLAQINPNTAVVTSSGTTVLPPASQLRALEAEYYSKEATYAPEHPDLVKLRREIDQLRKVTGASADSGELKTQLDAKKAELGMLKKKYADSHPDIINLTRSIKALEEEYKKIRNKKERPAPVVNPDNPAYIQILAQLETTKQEIRSLRTQSQDLKTKLATYEERIIESPQVEREYSALTRDHQNALTKYKEIKDKQMEAKMAEELELGSKGERFSLIEPPFLPQRPSKPNRIAIILLGIILSFASGIATVFIRESLDHSIRGAKKLAAVLGTSPLAVIPYIDDGSGKLDHKRNFLTRWRAWAGSH